jgi:hypothetical protein
VEASCKILTTISLKVLSAGDIADCKIQLHSLRLRYLITFYNKAITEGAPSFITCRHTKALKDLTRELSSKFYGASIYFEVICEMHKSSENIIE